MATIYGLSKPLACAQRTLLNHLVTGDLNKLTVPTCCAERKKSTNVTN